MKTQRNLSPGSSNSDVEPDEPDDKPKDGPYKDWYTRRQVEDLLGCSRRTLQRRQKDGEFETGYYRCARGLVSLYNPTQVEAALAKQQQGSGSIIPERQQELPLVPIATYANVLTIARGLVPAAASALVHTPILDLLRQVAQPGSGVTARDLNAVMRGDVEQVLEALDHLETLDKAKVDIEANYVKAKTDIEAERAQIALRLESLLSSLGIGGAK